MNKTDCYKCARKPSMHCGECPVWLAGEEVSEKERIAYQQGEATARAKIINIIENCCWRDAEMLVEMLKEQCNE